MYFNGKVNLLSKLEKNYICGFTHHAGPKAVI